MRTALSFKNFAASFSTHLSHISCSFSSHEWPSQGLHTVGMAIWDVSFMGWVLTSWIAQNKCSSHVLYLGGALSKSSYLSYYQGCEFTVFIYTSDVWLNQANLKTIQQQYCSHIITQVHWKKHSRMSQRFFGTDMASLIMLQCMVLSIFLPCFAHSASLSQHIFCKLTFMSSCHWISYTKPSRVHSKTTSLNG